MVASGGAQQALERERTTAQHHHHGHAMKKRDDEDCRGQISDKLKTSTMFYSLHAPSMCDVSAFGRGDDDEAFLLHTFSFPF